MTPLDLREYAEALRIAPHGYELGDEILDLLDTAEIMEAVQWSLDHEIGADSVAEVVEAMARIVEVDCVGSTMDETRESVISAIVTSRRVRAVLIETGALAHDDTDTPLDGLLRALLS